MGFTYSQLENEAQERWGISEESSEVIVEIIVDKMDKLDDIGENDLGDNFHDDMCDNMPLSELSAKYDLNIPEEIIEESLDNESIGI